MLGAQREEQVGLGLEAVVGAVVDHRRQVGRGFEDRPRSARAGRPARCRATGRAGSPSGPCAPTFCACAASAAARCGFCAPVPTITGTPAFDQALDALLRCCVGEQRPVAHRAAIDDRRHAGRDQCRPCAPARRNRACVSRVQGVIRAGMQPWKGEWAMAEPPSGTVRPC